MSIKGVMNIRCFSSRYLVSVINIVLIVCVNEFLLGCRISSISRWFWKFSLIAFICLFYYLSFCLPGEMSLNLLKRGDCYASTAFLFVFQPQCTCHNSVVMWKEISQPGRFHSNFKTLVSPDTFLYNNFGIGVLSSSSQFEYLCNPVPSRWHSGPHIAKLDSYSALSERFFVFIFYIPFVPCSYMECSN